MRYGRGIDARRTGPETLAELLLPAKVDAAVLEERYGPLLALVRRMLGVDPNSSGYLEIWPPAFRTYNLIVPNFFNLPLSVFGFATAPEILGLAMYASSRAAGCMYCSAHSCTLAMRRGMSADKLAQAIGAVSDDALTAKEKAVVAVAAGLSSQPPTLASEHVTALRQCFSEGDVAWIVAVVAMMGLLNKTMDMFGLELEEAVYEDVHPVIGASGWREGRHRVAESRGPIIPLAADTLRSKLGWIPYLPAALRADKRWTDGIPDGAVEARKLLHEHVGHDFPVLSRLESPRVVKALTTALRDAFREEDSVVGTPTKVVAGLVFAAHNDDRGLVTASVAMAERAGVSPDVVEAVIAYAREPLASDDAWVDDAAEAISAIDGLSKGARAALLLAKGGASSPVRLPPELLARCEGALEPAAIVEVVVWLGLLQLLRRFDVFYGLSP